MITGIKLSSNREELLGQLTSVLSQLKEDVLYLLAGNWYFFVHAHNINSIIHV